MRKRLDERMSGFLEQAPSRAMRLLGGEGGDGGAHESAAGAGPPGGDDIERLAKLIAMGNPGGLVDARVMAAEIVRIAQKAMADLKNDPKADLDETVLMSLEAVMKSRGRPAVRLLDGRLDELRLHEGAEAIWDALVHDCEPGVVATADATGLIIVPELCKPEGFMRGSGWLARPNILVTNRHVLTMKEDEFPLIERKGAGAVMRPYLSLAVDFKFDNRTKVPPSPERSRVKAILYVAPDNDPIDIAVLELEQPAAATPLRLAHDAAPAPESLCVVGHPAPLANPAPVVKKVFGDLDKRKRASFGLQLSQETAVLSHDASTVGGYSGGPVVALTPGGYDGKVPEVAGLHFYGDPEKGNLAVRPAAIRRHASYGYMGGGA